MRQQIQDSLDVTLALLPLKSKNVIEALNSPKAAALLNAHAAERGLEPGRIEASCSADISVADRAIEFSIRVVACGVPVFGPRS
jgi:hypothetical protein